MIIGDFTFINSGCRFDGCIQNSYIKNGSHCLIGPRCLFECYNHRGYLRRTKTNENEVNSIIVEDFVWIGANVTVLGVKIGKGSVIGVGSLVNKDIPPYVLTAGVPVKIIKRLID